MLSGPDQFMDTEVKGSDPKERQIFLSYTWADDTLAKSIDEYFYYNLGVILIRDIRDAKPGTDLYKFMNEAVKLSDTVLLLITKDYLVRPNCMYEALKALQFHRRSKLVAIPLVHGNAEVSKPKVRAAYYKHWDKEIKELEESIQVDGVELQNIKDLKKDLQMYRKIRSTMQELMHLLAKQIEDRFNEPDERFMWSLARRLELKELNILEFRSRILREPDPVKRRELWKAALVRNADHRLLVMGYALDLIKNGQREDAKALLAAACEKSLAFAPMVIVFNRLLADELDRFSNKDGVAVFAIRERYEACLDLNRKDEKLWTAYSEFLGDYYDGY